jgi:bifunctional DNA-binding transcriptional regulator/antitoxin component of YhaV-PrlF toxin-antitoxin module
MPTPTRNPGPISYSATIEQEEVESAAAWVVFPHDLKELYGIGNLVPVVVTFDGIQYRGSIAKMGPEPMLLIRSDIRKQLGKARGDSVEVTVTLDTTPRTVKVPPELATAFRDRPDAQKRFKELSYTNQREYAEWITSSKRPDTKERRIAKAVDMIAAGKPLR